MGNFEFLNEHKDLSELKVYCEDAESFAKSRPELSAISARKAVEFLVKYIYKAEGGKDCNNKKLLDLINSNEVQNFINDKLILDSLNYIRILGNNGAHNGNLVSKSEALLCLENLYFFVAEALTRLKIIDFYPSFDENNLPSTAREKIIVEEDIKADNTATTKLFTKSVKQLSELPPSYIPDYLSEATTRTLYIDARIKEAGWKLLSLNQKNVSLPSTVGVEIEVNGLPTESGVGYCDYVMFGSDGKPLAVIEAKKTLVDPEAGRYQGIQYCDCLEKQYGRRPILYYTNGCDYYIYDGVYPDRKVSGFYREDELEHLLFKQNVGELTDTNVDSNIAGWLFQEEAIKKVTEHYNEKHRKALLVMATGTGKTRVAVEIIDILFRNKWIKNVLFLADRTALVNQAAKVFKQFLPGESQCTLSDDYDPNMNASIMFSTYQTMIHCIDKDTKDFGIGRFDIIIVDEAHRSIFNKYRAIFVYFDSLLLGLTATPRENVDKNTYDFFECNSGEPNFAYSYDEAVHDGYLVPFNEPYIKTTNFLSQGIKYDDLSETEKEQYEDEELYKEYGDNIPSNEINRLVLNNDTIDIVLESLMNNGLKIDDGNKLGKTIIFAVNHKHAELIVRRFRLLYPEKGSEFCQLIDNKVKNHDSLILKFETNKDFQIAVSVDMLDTGIDIPELLNLVFFKSVKSKIKFWQMIGRGTRLCPNLLGPGINKTHFLIFDWCGNFQYFSIIDNEKEDSPNDSSLNQKIFVKRLEILKMLQSADNQDIDFNREYYGELKKQLIATIKHMKEFQYRVLISEQITYVDKYCKDSEWVDITDVKEREIIEYIAPLVEGQDNQDVLVLKFDLKMLTLEYELLGGTPIENICASRRAEQLKVACRNLLNNSTNPRIHEKVDELRKFTNDAFWENVSLSQLEKARKELRELMIFVDGEEKRLFYTDFKDTEEDVDADIDFASLSLHTYKDKVIDYLTSHNDNPVIQKIRNLEQLTQADVNELEEIFWGKLGTREDYEQAYENFGSLAALVRSIVDLSNDAINNEINQFIEKYNLNSDQIQFIRMIVDYVNQNGDIDLSVFTQNPAFEGYNITRIFGANIGVINEIVDSLHSVICAA